MFSDCRLLQKHTTENRCKHKVGKHKYCILCHKLEPILSKNFKRHMREIHKS